MRSPIIVFCVLTSLMIPSLAWACGAGGMEVFLLAAAVAALGLTFISAIGISCFVSFFEGYHAREVDKPRFWIVRLMTVGLVGLGLTLAGLLAIDYWAASTLIAPGVGVAVALTTPLVLQSAYAAWTWHRGHIE